MIYSTVNDFQPILAFYDKATGKYRVAEDYTFEWVRNGKRYRLTIPKGFLYDKASVPGFIPPIIAREDGPWDTGSALHDAAYKFCKHGGFFPPNMYQEEYEGHWIDAVKMSRSDADWLLGYAGRLGGATPFSAALYKWSVKLYPINWFKGF